MLNQFNSPSDEVLIELIVVCYTVFGHGCNVVAVYELVLQRPAELSIDIRDNAAKLANLAIMCHPTYNMKVIKANFTSAWFEIRTQRMKS